MEKRKAYLYISYENYKGGVNNLTVVKVKTKGVGYEKCFTTTKLTAEQLMKKAKKWATENNFII